MKLNEVAGPNLKRIALQLQTMLIDKDLPGFEVTGMEGIESFPHHRSPKADDGTLISVKLSIGPCPKESLQGTRRFSYTGHSHTIEVYKGPMIRFESNMSSITGRWCDVISEGIFFFADAGYHGETSLRTGSVRLKTLVGFMPGLTPEDMQAFVNEYANGWGQ